MGRTDRNYSEAKAKLQGYLASGIGGLLQQAWDRLADNGMNLAGVAKDRNGAMWLLEHLRLSGV